MKKALKRHGSPEAITTDGLRSYGAAVDELGCQEKQEIGRWANNRWRTRTCHSDDGSERCSGSGGWAACRSSLRFTPTSTITSSWNAISSIDKPTRIDAPQLLRSGRSLRARKQRFRAEGILW